MYTDANPCYLYFAKGNYSTEKELKEDIINTIFILFKNGYEVIVKDEDVGYSIYFVNENESLNREIIAIIDSETQYIGTYDNNTVKATED